jgi:hypothetical protein
MIQIICGESSIASRDYFLEIKKNLQKQNYFISEVKSENITDLTEPETITPLFYQNKAFFAENLYQKISKNKKIIDKLEQLFSTKFDLYIWEEKTKYELKSFSRFKIIEFKLEKNIFNLLDNFFPGNKKSFYTMLHQIINEKNENLFFYLLTKRIRQLILVKTNQNLPSVLQWQVYRLKKQASKWSLANLVKIYQSFFSIEIDLKTSQTPYTLLQLIDITSCYFL